MKSKQDVDIEYIADELVELRKEVQYLRDRQAILDTMTLYARALDRHDWDLLCDEVVHPDGIVDLGGLIGNAKDLIDQIDTTYNRDLLIHSHVVSNHVCEIDGDVAHTETYVITYLLLKDGKRLRSTHARYVDRLEKRDGKWKIALRRVIRDALTEVTAVGEAQPEGTWERTDPSYERPLTLPPERKALIKR